MADKDIYQFDLNLNGEEDVQPKRRRHTQHQIQELESFFKDWPNPDYRQRRALSLELGLEPQQVKYWFQNKRTQLKGQHGHLENMELHAENERLKAENTSLMEQIKNVACLSCAGPMIREMSDTERLRAENVHLREEIDRVSATAAQYIGKPLTDSD
ncbi:hypothetical protein F511_01512 [Dorcoceras hygrometricum]|nr:hypothetical protein F511_01512 [Dorcoceras hygrometricum]